MSESQNKPDQPNQVPLEATNPTLIQPSTNGSTPEVMTRDPQVSGFWRRLVAFGIDSFLLWLIGQMMIALTLAYHPQAIGYGAYMGFAIALLYFGIMNSYFRRGQTIGKLILNIFVVDREGKFLGFGKSFLRAMLLSSLICFQNFGALTWLVFVYLYIFNRRTRQSLHDVILSTFVVRTDGIERPLFARVWKVHYVAVGILFILTFLPAIAAFTGGTTQGDPELQSMKNEIEKMEAVKTVQIQFGDSGKLGDSNKKKNMSVGVFLSQKPTENMEAKIAKVVLEKYPPAQHYDILSIQLIEATDMGIARNSMSHGYNYSPKIWKDQIEKMDNNK